MPNGWIRGYQIRPGDPRKGGKYRWLSSANRPGGTSSGVNCHVARPLSGAVGDEAVWITEGIFKADLAAERLGANVVSIPGVGCWRQAMPDLAELLPHGGDVVVAMDSDWRENAAVHEAAWCLAQVCAAIGYGVEVALWEPTHKGLDDLLTAGMRPRRTGPAAVPAPAWVPKVSSRRLAEITATAGMAAETVTLAEMRARLPAATEGRPKRVPLPVITLVAGPTGSGKTTAMAKHVARTGATCWLADKHVDVDAAVAAIEAAGGNVGRVVPLDGMTGKTPNCLRPDVISCWQFKGYNYVPGYCKPWCDRAADPKKCPFIRSLIALEEADIIVATKALARRAGFYSAHGNAHRQTVVLDEDPIDLMRPAVKITRDELEKYVATLDKIDKKLRLRNRPAALAQSAASRRIATWLFDQTSRKPIGDQPEAVPVPADLKPSKPVLSQTKKQQKKGRNELLAEFHYLMHGDPGGTIRNVYRDLNDLVKRQAGKTVFVTAQQTLFHLRLNIPSNRQVFILDATANAELLRPIFAPRPVEVVCNERVEPAGRIIQLMDFNGPRSYLNKLPSKLVRIIDAIGERHPRGNLVLISHQSCVKDLAKASQHSDRIKTAYFGALAVATTWSRRDRTRSPAISSSAARRRRRKTAGSWRLAVYGKAILPFGDLIDTRPAVCLPIPAELVDTEDGPALRAGLGSAHQGLCRSADAGRLRSHGNGEADARCGSCPGADPQTRGCVPADERAVPEALVSRGVLRE